jgi:RNA polymerase subunit RPABC4/transcription elongation factor Spt4
MSGLRSELSIIPTWAWILSAVIALALAVGMPTAIELSDANAPPIALSLGLGLFMGVMLGTVGLLIGYVNGDAKRRGMRSALWTLVAIFVPNGLGFLIYFLMRDPLRLPCPSCGQLVQAAFNYCPSCHHALKPVCPSCGKGLAPEHTFCPYCGASIKAHAA